MTWATKTVELTQLTCDTPGCLQTFTAPMGESRERTHDAALKRGWRAVGWSPQALRHFCHICVRGGAGG